MIQIKTIIGNSTNEIDEKVNGFISTTNPQTIKDIKLQIEYDGQSYTQYIAMVIYNK